MQLVKYKDTRVLLHYIYKSNIRKTFTIYKVDEL